MEAVGEGVLEQWGFRHVFSHYCCRGKLWQRQWVSTTFLLLPLLGRTLTVAAAEKTVVPPSGLLLGGAKTTFLLLLPRGKTLAVAAGKRLFAPPSGAPRKWSPCPCIPMRYPRSAPEDQARFHPSQPYLGMVVALSIKRVGFLLACGLCPSLLLLEPHY